jgi:hypothetical protein
MFTEPCEAIFNTHPDVHRSALVGVGEAGNQQPVIIAEPWPEHVPKDKAERAELESQLLTVGQSHDLTKSIERVLIYPKRLPTDIRHNSKIFREQLVPWAADQIQLRKRS